MKFPRPMKRRIDGVEVPAYRHKEALAAVAGATDAKDPSTWMVIARQLAHDIERLKNERNVLVAQAKIDKRLVRTATAQRIEYDRMRRAAARREAAAVAALVDSIARSRER